MSLDLEPIKARIARATPGPWRVKEADPRRIHRGTVQVEEHGRVIETVAECYCGGYEGHGLHNAELVANAPTDLDALVAEVERLRAQRALDNAALARAWDEGRDMERAATVAWLREAAYTTLYDARAGDVADALERGVPRREEER